MRAFFAITFTMLPYAAVALRGFDRRDWPGDPANIGTGYWIPVKASMKRSAGRWHWYD